MSISKIGLDTAKSVFQVHAVDEAGMAEIRRKLRRSELIPFFEQQEPARLSWRRAARLITGLAC